MHRSERPDTVFVSSQSKRRPTGRRRNNIFRLTVQHPAKVHLHLAPERECLAKSFSFWRRISPHFAPKWHRSETGVAHEEPAGCKSKRSGSAGIDGIRTRICDLRGVRVPITPRCHIEYFTGKSSAAVVHVTANCLAVQTSRTVMHSSVRLACRAMADC